MANVWDKVKAGLNAVAPILANAVVPGSGGAAAALISSVLGVPNTPDAIETAVANLTPDQAAALKQAEMKHEEELIRLGSENDRIYLQDVQDARKTELGRMAVTGKKDANLYLLAWTFIFGFFILMGVMMVRTVPQENVGPVNQLFGALAGGVGLVLGYFFGSSKGSQDKNDVIAEIVKK